MSELFVGVVHDSYVTLFLPTFQGFLMFYALLTRGVVRYDDCMFDVLTSGTINSSALALFPAPFIALMVWSLAWKGFSLWRAAQKGSKPWFIALLLINSLGILDILYLFIFSKMDSKQTGEQQSQEQ